MEKIRLDKDVNLFCVKAGSFPEGIMEAFQVLETLAPEICKRPFYGISYPCEDGKIIYKAAVLELRDGEGTSYGLETFTVPAGTYAAETVSGFRKDPSGLIGSAFQRLLTTPGLERFPCVEWYKGKDEVVCMVKVHS